MTDYGLTTEGFVLPSAEDILAAIEAAQRAAPALGAALGDELDLSPESPLGQMNTIMATRFRMAYEMGKAVYDARSTSTFGQALVRLCALTGTTPSAGVKSRVTLRVTLAAGVTLPAGSVAAVLGAPTNRWVTQADATNASGAPTSVDVLALAETVGAQAASSGAITVLATPFAGWTAVYNVSPALVGAGPDSDPRLRRRRDEEIHAAGSSPVDALFLALSKVADVVQVLVFANETDATDPDGRPPHTVEAIVLGGDDVAVAQTLWQAKGGGIGTYGLTTVNATDAAGNLRPVRFTRPVDRQAYAAVRLQIDPARYAGDAAVALAIETYVASLALGEMLELSALPAVVRAVRGVRNLLLSSVALGWSPSALRAQDLAPTVRERLVLQAAHVTVEQYT